MHTFSLNKRCPMSSETFGEKKNFKFQIFAKNDDFSWDTLYE